MVEERQIDGIIDFRGHLPHLPLRWIRMWTAWMVEVHWIEERSAKPGGWQGLYDLRKSAVFKIINYTIWSSQETDPRGVENGHCTTAVVYISFPLFSAVSLVTRVVIKHSLHSVLICPMSKPKTPCHEIFTYVVHIQKVYNYYLSSSANPTSS